MQGITGKAPLHRHKRTPQRGDPRSAAADGFIIRAAGRRRLDIRQNQIPGKGFKKTTPRRGNYAGWPFGKWTAVYFSL